MKFKLFIILIALVSYIPSTIAQSWLWSDAISSTNDLDPKGLAIDDNENIYILGQFDSTLTIGTQTVNSTNDQEDLFVAKFNNDGDLLWIKQAGGEQKETPKAIALDESGNVYITGAFKDTCGFGPNPSDTIYGNVDGNEDVFLAKYSTLGVLQWAINAAGGPGKDRGAGLVVDQSGDIVVIGFFNDSLEFDGDALADTFNQNSNFIAKFNNNGGFIWVSPYESSNKKTRFNSISICESGGANLGYYISGYFHDDITIGTTTLTESGGGDVADIMLFRINNDGDVINWTSQGGGTTDDQSYSCASSPNGDVYITGYIQGSATFDTEVINGSGGADIFIAKYDINGDLQWVKGYGGSGNDLGSGIFVSDTTIYVSGYFSGTTVWGEDILRSGSSSNQDAFFSTFNTDGDIIGAEGIQGELEERGVNIVASNEAQIYLCGFFYSDSLFIQDDTLLNGGTAENIFFSKYGCNPINISSEDYTDISCNGEDDGTITITATGDIPLSYSINGGSSFETDSAYANLAADDYNIEVKDVYNCSETGSTITITEPLASSITSEEYTDITCNGDDNGTITITATGNSSLNYSINGGVSFESDSFYTDLAAGNYFVIVQDTNDCTKTGSTISITSPQAILITEIDVSNQSSSTITDGEITIAATGGTGLLTYIIEPDTSNMPTILPSDTTNITGEFTDLAAGGYFITISDGNNCTNTINVEVSLTESDEIEIYNAFTPNGDDRNQVWNIKNIHLFPNCDVKIYNLWGNLIFHSKGYENPWNGTYKGNDLPTAAYFYIIDLGNGSKLQTGSVSIIR